MTILASTEIGLIILGLAGVLLVIFWLWMLIECVAYETNEGNKKAMWLLILLVGNWIGALLYLFVRRPQRKAEVGK